MKEIEVRSFDRKEEVKEKKELSFKANISKLQSEHPTLSLLYEDLNSCIEMKHKMSRSRDLARNYENEETSIRKRIKEYERAHNITREDHLRWNTNTQIIILIMIDII